MLTPSYEYLSADWPRDVDSSVYMRYVLSVDDSVYTGSYQRKRTTMTVIRNRRWKPPVPPFADESYAEGSAG